MTVVSPRATASRRPAADTVAIAGLAELQVTLLVMFCTVPSSKVPRAIRGRWNPTIVVDRPGFTVTASSRAPVTVTVVPVDRPLELAVIRACPPPRVVAVTSPVAETVATSVSEDAQVAWAVKSRPSVLSRLICTVAPGASVGLPGVTSTDTGVVEVRETVSVPPLHPATRTARTNRIQKRMMPPTGCWEHPSPVGERASVTAGRDFCDEDHRQGLRPAIRNPPGMRLFAPTLMLLLAALPVHGQENAPKKVLMVVTSAGQMTNGHATGLWLEEFAVPYVLFRKAGLEVVVASPRGGPAPIDPRSAGETRPEWAEASQRLQTTLPLDDVGSAEFAAVFLPGGHGTMFDFPGDARLAALLSAFASEGKPVAAVCHGPAGLVGAHGPDGQALVKGKNVTGFTNAEEKAVDLVDAMPFLLESRLVELGGRFEGGPDFAPHVVVDGLLVTGQNPASSAPAAEALLRLLR